MGHYVYKYVFNGEIIYIGKCDSDLDQRLGQHGKSGDNIDKKYWDDIKSGKRLLVSIYTARKSIVDLMKEYNCTTICAHNARFDYNALNNTVRYITKSKYRYFFSYGCIWWDTLKMSRQIYKNRPTYNRFCTKNGYKTKHKTPQNRLTAEILHRYLTGENDFIESHTGLEDVLIETHILAQCLRQHKKMIKELWG